VWYRCACVCVDGSSIWYAISLSRDLLYFSFFSFFFNYSFFTLVLTGACHSIHFALVEITARVILSPKWNVSLITTFHSLSISFNRKRSILCIHTYARANISPNDIQRSLSLSLSRLYKQIKTKCVSLPVHTIFTRWQQTSPPSSATSPPRSPRDTPRAIPAHTPRQCYSNEYSFSWETMTMTTMMMTKSKSI